MNNAGVSVREAPAFIDYIEGVYLGYKWYETADVEGIWDKYTKEIYDNNGNKSVISGYNSVVQYPFGYGLSYTEFEWTVESISIPNGSEINRSSEIIIQVGVKNVGKVAGQDVVQIYFTPEYKIGEIEKSHVSLVGFDKTKTLKPGETEILTIKVDVEDLACYDAYDLNNNGNKGYELDSGNYEIKLMIDSHNIKNVTFRDGQSNVPGVITYKVSKTINFVTDNVTGSVVSNKFTGEDCVEGVSIDGSDSGQDIGFISRASFPDPYEVKDVTDRKMANNVKKFNTYSKKQASEWDNATVDIWGNPVDTSEVIWYHSAGEIEYDGISYADEVGEDSNTKVYMDGKVTRLGLLLGSDYNHPLWEDVLNQISFYEAIAVVLRKC